MKPLILAAVLALASTAASAQALSPAVGRPLEAAKRLAQGGGSTAAAIAQVNTARAAADTPAERRFVAQTAAYVYTRGGNFAAAAKELESIGAGPRELAPFYYRSGQLDKAVAMAKRAGGPQMQLVMAQSFIKMGKYGEAASTYRELIRQSGPQPQYLEALASAQYRGDDKAGYLDTVRQLIRTDPSPARWKTLLYNLRGQDMADPAKVALYQLMRQTGNLTDPADVQEFSKLAILSNLPGVALGALNDARAANVINAGDPMTARLVQESGKRANAALAGVAKLPRTPAGYLEAGNAFFGANRYPQAVAAYKGAIGGGGAVADQARVLSGIALIRAGNAGGARQLLAQVPQGSGFRDVAQLWDLYAATQRG